MELKYQTGTRPDDWATQTVLLFHHVPDVVWAALVAAGVAFLTTTLSNRNSRKQVKMQLDADARERKREREQTLRRDVYLPAAEAIARAYTALGQMTDINSEQREISNQVSADLATMAKINLVASMATVKAFMAFQRAFMPVYIKLIAMRAPLTGHQQLIEIEQKHADRANTTVWNMIELMREHNISGVQDPAKFQRLQKQIDESQKLYDLHSGRKLTLIREQADGQLTMVATLTELLGSITSVMPTAIISSRNDIDLPIDAQEYQRLFAIQQEAAREIMATVVDDVRRAIRGGTG